MSEQNFTDEVPYEGEPDEDTVQSVSGKQDDMEDDDDTA